MYKRAILLLVCFFAFTLPSHAAPNVTVTASSQSILGTTQTISLTVTLIDPNQTGMLKSGAVVVTNFSATSTSGTSVSVGPIYGNDVITDGFGNSNATYYKVQVFTVSNSIIASTPSLQNFYAFTGSGTVDLSTATPLAPSFMSGANGSVVVPGTFSVTGNMAGPFTFTGNNTHSGTETFTNTLGSGNFDGQFFVDGQQFSGCPAATTAATTYASGTTITIPGTGPIVNCAVTVPENIIIRNFDRTRDWCNGAGGAATPPCNAVNYNYDDGNVYAAERHEMTTSHQDLNGATLGLYTITHLKNATANGNSGIDGFSAEANTEGTLSGTFRGASANEMDANIGSTGGTITEVNGGLGYVNSLAGNTTAITTANGFHGVGCNTAPGAKPTNCYGGNFEEQTLATSRNYALRWAGRAIGVWGNSQTSGFDLEESNHTTHPTLYGTGASPNTLLNLQALTAGGFSLNTADGVPRLTMDSIGRLFVTQSLNATGTGVTLGGSGAWSSLRLGSNNDANSFTFTPAATAAARSVNLWDFGANGPSTQNFPGITILTSQYTNSTTGMTTVTGGNTLQFPVLANTTYTAECHLYYQAAATGGLNIQFTGPAAATTIVYGLNLPVSATAQAGDSVATAFSTSLGAVVTTAATNFDAIVSLALINGANAGTVTLQAKSSAAVQLQIQAGSFCRVQ